MHSLRFVLCTLLLPPQLHKLVRVSGSTSVTVCKVLGSTVCCLLPACALRTMFGMRLSHISLKLSCPGDAAEAQLCLCMAPDSECHRRAQHTRGLQVSWQSDTNLISTSRLPGIPVLWALQLGTGSSCQRGSHFGASCFVTFCPVSDLSCACWACWAMSLRKEEVAEPKRVRHLMQGCRQLLPLELCRLVWANGRSMVDDHLAASNVRQWSGVF